jgi:hypothetical protein
MIQRPRFLSGSTRKNDNRLKPYHRQPRTLLEPILRPNNFKAPDPRSRFIPDFDGLRALDERQSGIKVQLSDKTLASLLNVQVPDKSDQSWLDEKNRRLTAGETEQQIDIAPPFGRVQRTVTRKTNLGDANNSIETQLQAVTQSIAQGNTLTRNAIVQLGASLVPNITNTKTTVEQIALAQKAAARLGIPQSWKDAGLAHRLWSSSQFARDAGEILLFLLSTTPQGFDVKDKFLVKLDENGNIVSEVSFKNFSSELRGHFLDVENRAIIPVVLAKNLTQNDGVDNSQLDLTQPTPPKVPIRRSSRIPKGAPPKGPQWSP